MGKGPDQGDYETPTPVDTAEPSQWPTEPDQAPSTGPDEVGTPTLGTPPEDPGTPGHLPTTSGTEAVGASLAAVSALALIATGITLAWKRHRRPHW